MSILKLARAEIQALAPYSAAIQLDDTIRLNANESARTNVFGNYRRPLNRYPEIRPRALQEKLAARFGCTAEQLLVTRGSSEAIDLIIRTFCRAGIDNIVVPTPSFSMYGHYAMIQNAKLIEVPTAADNGFQIDIDALLEACDDSSKIIFLCSPNNPTGTTIPRDDILRLIRERGDRSAIVVDEAYVEFGGEKSLTEILQQQPNLLVLRTLSKALGLAGARCGAVAASPDIIAMLNAVQAPYALATPVVECVEELLQSDQMVLAEKSVDDVISERTRLSSAIAQLDFVEKLWPSDANFFLMRVVDPTAIMQRCASRKILLRQFGGALSNCIRVTVGSRLENDQLLQALGSLSEPQQIDSQDGM